MRAHQLRALHGYRTRCWSVGTPAMLIPNILQRQFTVTRPNKAWVTDITYIRTWQGWLYVAVVLDLFGIGIPIGVAEVWRGSARRARGPRAVLVGSFGPLPASRVARSAPPRVVAPWHRTH